MKDFLKTMLAVIAAMIVMSILNTITYVTLILTIGLSGNSKPVVENNSALVIDMSKISIAEQSASSLQSMMSVYGQGQVTTIGIWDAVRSLNQAALDSAIKYVILKTDGVSGGMAQLEEFRKGLCNFRMSGKPVIAYTENPSNGSYYLASMADKIYMNSSEGGMNMVVGLSSRIVFLKDILDKLGVNVQLIRHGKYKSAGEMYIKSDISPENRLQYETFIGSIWGDWSEEIAQSRGISAEDFNALIDNLALNLPQDFLQHGLVDELVTKGELYDKLATYSEVENFDKAKLVSLADYVEAKTPKESLFKEKIAVIYVDGEIVDGNNAQQVAGDRFASIIRSVRKDDLVKAVVFRVNSPGGSVMASEKIKNEMDLLCAQKPVVASYANYAASGGYWISNACSKIYTDKSTLTGSIGVFSMIPDFSKTAKNLAHVNIVSINSNKHSDMYSLMRPLDTRELAYMQQSVEVIYDRFVKLVAQGRSLEPDFVDSVAQGRVWAGSDALEIGLVDEIGTLEDALRFAAAMADSEHMKELSDYTVAAYPKPLTPFEEIMLQLAGDPGEELVMAGTPFESVESAFRHFKAEKAGQVYARLPYEMVIE